jgi:hypothetical protein
MIRFFFLRTLSFLVISSSSVALDSGRVQVRFARASDLSVTLGGNFHVKRIRGAADDLSDRVIILRTVFATWFPLHPPKSLSDVGRVRIVVTREARDVE